MSYWVDRAKEAMKAEEAEDRKVVDEIERIVKATEKDIEKEIFAFYSKYADKEGLSIDEAKKVVDAFDVAAFKEKAKKYVEDKDFSPVANQELRLYNTKMYISREELLKGQIRLLLIQMTSKIEKKAKAFLQSSVYSEIKRQSGILGENVSITKEKVQAIVNMKFYGATWSKKLWNNMKIVRKKVEKTMSHMLLRGRHPNEFVKELREATGQTVYNSKRLLLTEATRTRSEAQILTFKETLGDDGLVQYVAKLDERTTVICRGLDGKTFKVSELVPGVNCPPMHPFCRSILAEAKSDWREKFFEERKGKYNIKLD